MGFFRGGSLALLHSSSGTPNATVVHYANLGADQHAILPNPMLLHIAETDQWEAGANPREFAERVREHGTPLTAHAYLGTVHGFANATAHTYVHAAAVAFARTAVFLESHLN